MGLSITLPSGIRQHIQDIAAQKGEKVEHVVITAVLHYIAREQRTESPGDVLKALECSQRLYQKFKDRLCQRYPSLGDAHREQAVATMEKLSDKVVEGMAFTTWQGAEAFMRGEEHYDFARQQYLFEGRTSVAVMTPDDFLAVIPTL